MMPSPNSDPTAWPELPFDAWSDTRETLHRWTQIVGKIRLGLTPLVNHWWNVPLYLTARGLTTSEMPAGDGRSLDIEFDFLAHALRFRLSDGRGLEIPLAPRSVADFYREVLRAMRTLGVDCTIRPMTVEIPDELVPLDQDEIHRAYDPEAVVRFWRALARVEAVLTRFRARFIGKCSPVHFFWGAFDLAVTRFSGRPAPPRPDADFVTREGYSHEVSSVGFWPGDARLPEASFYAYASPEPEGFSTAAVAPPPVRYLDSFGGFYLPYDAVRRADDPAGMLLEFCQSTYEAAADRGGWDRASLERPA